MRKNNLSSVTKEKTNRKKGFSGVGYNSQSENVGRFTLLLVPSKIVQ